jgi:hypothetical protein
MMTRLRGHLSVPISIRLIAKFMRDNLIGCITADSRNAPMFFAEVLGLSPAMWGRSA